MAVRHGSRTDATQTLALPVPAIGFTTSVGCPYALPTPTTRTSTSTQATGVQNARSYDAAHARSPPAASMIRLASA